MHEDRRFWPFVTAAVFILLAISTWRSAAEASSARRTSQTNSAAAVAPTATEDKTPIVFEHWGYNPAPGALLEIKEAQRGVLPD